VRKLLDERDDTLIQMRDGITKLRKGSNVDIVQCVRNIKQCITSGKSFLIQSQRIFMHREKFSIRDLAVNEKGLEKGFSLVYDIKFTRYTRTYNT